MPLNITDNDDLPTCSICAHNYNSSTRRPMVLNCAHSYCSTCTTRILNDIRIPMCPHCRSPFGEADVKVNYELSDSMEKMIKMLEKLSTNEQNSKTSTSSSVNAQGKTNLYIKKLNLDVDDNRLAEMFRKYGPVQSAKVSRDNNNVSKGFGYVNFVDPNHAKQAIDSLNGKPHINSSTHLYVNYHQTKNERSPVSTPAPNSPVTQQNQPPLAPVPRPRTNLTTASSLPSINQPALIQKRNRQVAGSQDQPRQLMQNIRTTSGLNSNGNRPAMNPVHSPRPARGNSVQQGAPRGKSMSRPNTQNTQTNAVTPRQQTSQQSDQTSYGANLRVENLDPRFNDEDLRRVFAPFGKLITATVSKVNEQPIGHVCFVFEAHADLAISMLDKSKAGNNYIYITKTN